MNMSFNPTLAGADPIQAILASHGECVLAVISGIEGPSYRPMGAMMAVFPDQMRVGTLSSGCIEADIALHAIETLQQGTPRVVRYGHGSPFIDIELPCGGGLDILLIPSPDKDALRIASDRQAARDGCSLKIDMVSGDMDVGALGETRREADSLYIGFEPALRFLVFGKGPEASTFASLVQSAGYPNVLLSPDTETLQVGAGVGSDTQHLTSQSYPAGLKADDRTAVVLFFHDHDWEPQIIQGALKTDAFYIGSQGSQRARAKRVEALLELGVSDAEIERLHGPVGLIPSARDPGTLAVSVLAEVLAKATKPVA